MPRNEQNSYIPPEAIKRPGSEQANQLKVVELQNSPEWLTVVEEQIRENYEELFRDRKPGETGEMIDEIVRRTVVEDEYGSPERSITLIATTAEGNFAGTCRLGLGQAQPKDETYPLETMHLVQPVNEHGKDMDWPHHEAGLTDNQVAEVGRVVVDKSQRKKRNTTQVVKSLIDRAAEIFQDRGIKMGYIISNERLNRHFAHVKSLDYQGIVPMRLRIEAQDIADTTENFDKYWKNENNPPQLRVFTVPDVQAVRLK